MGGPSRRPREGNACAAAPRALFTRGSKSFPPRRDAGKKNNRQSPSAGACAGRGAAAGSGAEQPPQPLPQPGRTAGWGPEVTQRSRRDKRHPPALAPIPGAPRPLTSLRRPSRTPLCPPGQSFPWPGSAPPGREWPPGSRRPRPPRQDLFAPSPPPLLLPPTSSLPPRRSPRSPGAHGGAGGPAAALRRRRPGEAGGRGLGPPQTRAPLTSPPRSRARGWFSRSLFRSSGRLGAKPERAPLPGARKAANHAPRLRLPRPPPAAQSRARRSAASVNRARERRRRSSPPPRRGPAAAPGRQLSLAVWDNSDSLWKMLKQTAGGPPRGWSEDHRRPPEQLLSWSSVRKQVCEIPARPGLGSGG